MKEDRGGLKKLLELAKRRQIDAVVAHGLTRFGFEYLVEFKAYGVNVVAFQDDKDHTQELMEDSVEIEVIRL